MAVLATVGLGAIALSGLVFPHSEASAASSSESSVSASSGGNFDPGYIVSDANFYNGSALDAGAVQRFLLTKNSQCSSSFACLYNYSQNTPSMAASSYCRAMPGVAGESAASIIARVGAACGMSQQAMIVLLEKEQGLVSSSRPTQRAFEAATGFGCPDTAPCDSSYGGFFYQIYNAARQFQVYRAFPASFNYRPNATNNILYNPNAGCGSSPVFIRNAATAGLYNYTPYQPNAAALANMYGIGDACSAYGNRNFWRLWSDWFGSPAGSPDNLIRLAGTSYTYLVSGGVRYAFMSTDLLAQYSAFGAVREVSGSEFSRWVDGTQMQRAVRTSDGVAYLIDQSRRYTFTGCAQVADFGMSCATLPTVTSSQIALVPDGGGLTNIVELPDGGKWFVRDSQRDETPDPRVLTPYGIAPTSRALSNFSIGSLQIGPPIVTSGLFTDGAIVRLVNNSGTYTVAPAAAAGGITSSATKLQRESLERLPGSGTLPVRLGSGGRSLVAVDGGYLVVSGNAYGGPAYFSSAPTGAETGMPIAGTEQSPHYIRERSSGQVYLVSGGIRQPVFTDAQRAAISAMFGVQSRIWVAADGALGGIPQQAQRVSTTPDGSYYLVDGSSHYRVSGCPQLSDFGFSCVVVPAITAGQLSATRDGGALRPIISTQDGTKWFLQGGQRRELPDSSILAPYGVSDAFLSLSNASIGSLQIGPPIVGPGLYSDRAGKYRVATVAGNFDLAASAIAGGLTSRVQPIQAGSFDRLTSAGNLPLRLAVGGRSFIVVDGGLLRVNGADYGSDGTFTAMPGGAESGLPLVATQLNAHFIRERSDPQIYLVSGGYRQRVSGAVQRDAISATYGVPREIWLAADGALAGIVTR